MSELDEITAADLRAEDRWRRQQRERFGSGLNCRDPAHWGCPKCEPELFDEQDEKWLMSN